MECLLDKRVGVDSEAETRGVGRTAALCLDDALWNDMMRNYCLFCFNLFKNRTDSPEADQKTFLTSSVSAMKPQRCVGLSLISSRLATLSLATLPTNP